MKTKPKKRPPNIFQRMTRISVLARQDRDYAKYKGRPHPTAAQLAERFAAHCRIAPKNIGNEKREAARDAKARYDGIAKQRAERAKSKGAN